MPLFLHGKLAPSDVHSESWNLFSSNFNEGELEAIEAAMTDVLDRHASLNDPEIGLTCAEVVGSDWRGGPFEPIYYAAKQGEEEAGKLAGLILWRLVCERSDRWEAFKTQNSDEHQFMLYFRREA